jgi:hypothetical protein
MQGVIVDKEWALIELLPYHCHPDDRPALIVDAKRHPELFALFLSAFKQLNADATLIRPRPRRAPPATM